MASILDVGRRIDAARADDLSDDIIAAFKALRATVQRLSSATEGVLRIGITAHGVKTLQFNDRKYASPTMRLLGIGNASANVERSILKGWVFENTSLVTNMNAEQLGKLETLFLRALRDGSRSAQIQADVAAVVDGNINRARLIARDQIGKLNGQLDRQKQTEAGLDSYIWRGSLDERERPEHVAREGDVFKWSQPPPDGHPGQAVQCRCSAEPNLEPLLGKDFAAEPKSEADFTRATPEKRAENRRRRAAKLRRRKRRAARVPAAA
jgi:SPP1 gp7 family putative phage head morphogenesis protein